MEQLVADLKAAFRARIQKLDWMSPPTKVEALKKLDAFTVRIGYPDKWRDYGALVMVIRDDDLTGDVQRASAFEWLRQVHRLDRPVDKAEWDLTPQTVNAYKQSQLQRGGVSGRHPAARPSSIPTPMRPSILGPSAG